MACRVLRGRIRMRKFSHFLTDQNVEKHFFFFFASTKLQLAFRNWNHSPLLWLPGGSAGKKTTCNVEDLGSIPGLGRRLWGIPWWLKWWRICLQFRRPRLNPWIRKIPWRREWQPTPVFLPGEFHGQRSLMGYSPWDRKELDTTEQLTHATRRLCDLTENPDSQHDWSWSQIWNWHLWLTPCLCKMKTMKFPSLWGGKDTNNSVLGMPSLLLSDWQSAWNASVSECFFCLL